MSKAESGDGSSVDVGKQHPPTAQGTSSSSHTEVPVPPVGTDATTIGISSLSLADKAKDAKSPTTPPTPSTLEAVTTGTGSDLDISEHGDTEDGTKLPEPEKPRQVIAVSVSKSPSAFMNLAKKFLVTDEECDFSALEGAIVTAVDAAHLLERSKIATIVRISTSYPTVEPKKRREFGPSNASQCSGSPKTQTETGATSATTGSYQRQPQDIQSSSSQPVATAESAGSTRIIDHPGAVSATIGSSSSPLPPPPGASGKPSAKSPPGSLRRARIVITVRRTEAYVKWLEQNPIHEVHADDDRI